MRLAVLGGTFNPLHIGHCMLAETVVKELHYDKVLFVPAFVPPHKCMNGDVSAGDRLEMIRLFCSDSFMRGRDCFEAESCEIDRGGVSYTYDTIQFIIKKYSNVLEGRPAVILGQESFAQFYKWYRADELASSVELIVARRYPCCSGADTARFENAPSGNYTKDFSSSVCSAESKYPCVMLDNPVLPVSSTEIRSRAAGGRAFRYLVPDVVFQYISEHKLYGINDECRKR